MIILEKSKPRRDDNKNKSIENIPYVLRENEKYYFDESGKMQKGIIEVEGKKYLYGISSGKLYTGGLATITTGNQAGTYYTDEFVEEDQLNGKQ